MMAHLLLGSGHTIGGSMTEDRDRVGLRLTPEQTEAIRQYRKELEQLHGVQLSMSGTVLAVVEQWRQQRVAQCG